MYILFYMIKMSSTEVRRNFAAFLEKGSRQPIIIKRQNREVGAFIPMADWEKLRKIRMQELDEAAQSISRDAARKGLTEDVLNQILAEVNPS